MATTITCYKTELSPYDIDRPNDPYIYLQNCQKVNVTIDRDLCHSSLTYIEVEFPTTASFTILDCNYIEVYNPSVVGSTFYFVVNMELRKTNVATLKLVVDPWVNFINSSNYSFTVEKHSTVNRMPQSPNWYNGSVNYSNGVDGFVYDVTPFYFAGGSRTANSYDGRGIPVAFCEVSSFSSNRDKSYPVAFFSGFLGTTFQNTGLDYVYSELISNIQQINAAGNVSLSLDFGTTTITIQNVVVNRIIGVYIVPYYALSGLYNTATVANVLTPIENADEEIILYYDGTTLSRNYRTIIGASRTETSNYWRAHEDARKLYVGNGHSSVSITRGSVYNGARLIFEMSNTGFTLSVQDVEDTTSVVDLTSAIIVPNASMTFLFTETTSDAEKALSRIAAGSTVVAGGVALATGATTGNIAGIVGGVSAVSRGVSSIVSQEKQYRGEGANGYTSQGAGVDFDAYHTLQYDFDLSPVSVKSVEIPIISVYEIDSAGANYRASDLFYFGYPVGSVPVAMPHFSGPKDLLQILNTGTSDGFDYWLFNDLVLRGQAGDAGEWVRDLVEMLTTKGVRIWDTSTPEKCANFKRK